MLLGLTPNGVYMRAGGNSGPAPKGEKSCPMQRYDLLDVGALRPFGTPWSEPKSPVPQAFKSQPVSYRNGTSQPSRLELSPHSFKQLFLSSLGHGHVPSFLPMPRDVHQQQQTAPAAHRASNTQQAFT